MRADPCAHYIDSSFASRNSWSGSKSVQAWMTAHNMNTTGLSRYFWQQMSARVLPRLNRTIGSWCGIEPGRGPNPADLPVGSFGNAWHTDYQKVISAAIEMKSVQAPFPLSQAGSSSAPP